MPTIKRLRSRELPEPRGHYVHATVWENLIFVSGQLPIAADGAHQIDQAFEVQARAALANVFAIITEAGADWAQVLRLTAYVVDVEDHWALFDATCAATLADARPARTVVPVPHLHHGYLIEIDAVALKAAV